MDSWTIFRHDGGYGIAKGDHWLATSLAHRAAQELAQDHNQLAQRLAEVEEAARELVAVLDEKFPRDGKALPGITLFMAMEKVRALISSPEEGEA